jgi:hypothetical protein
MLEAHIMEDETSSITGMTSNIRLVRYGESETGEPFVKLRINGKIEVIIPLRDLGGGRAAGFEVLNRSGAHLISRAAQTELVNRIQSHRPEKQLLRVATKLGWHGREFIHPTMRAERTEVYLGDLPDALVQKYRVSGRFEGWSEIPRLARGNSRLMLVLALAFVGPIGDILRVEQVALQLVGSPGSGKTGIGIAAGSVWGCHRDRTLASSRGFGETWNHTVNNIEAVALAHNHALLVLDETRATRADVVLDTVVRFERWSEKGRLTDPVRLRSWWVPLLSTSNDTLDHLAVKGGRVIDDAYRSRLIDVPLPNGCASMFEELHGFADHATLTKHLIGIAVEHHGHAAKRYVKRLVRWRAEDAPGLKLWLQNRRAFYLTRAQKIVAAGRDLTRFHEKFATIYAAGRLAVRFELLPFSHKDLLHALLRCEKDHVGIVPTAESAPSAQEPEAFQRLCGILRSRPSKLLDLRSQASGQTPLGGAIGYIVSRNGTPEYLFTEQQFEQLAGGRKQAQTLKSRLYALGAIATSGSGRRLRYAVKRKLPGSCARTYFVVVRDKIVLPLTSTS